MSAGCIGFSLSRSNDDHLKLIIRCSKDSPEGMSLRDIRRPLRPEHMPGGPIDDTTGPPGMPGVLECNAGVPGVSFWRSCVPFWRSCVAFCVCILAFLALPVFHSQVGVVALLMFPIFSCFGKKKRGLLLCCAAAKSMYCCRSYSFYDYNAAGSARPRPYFNNH